MTRGERIAYQEAHPEYDARRDITLDEVLDDIAAVIEKIDCDAIGKAIGPNIPKILFAILRH